MNSDRGAMAGDCCRRSSTGSADPLLSSGGWDAGRESVDAEDTRGLVAAVCAGAKPAGDRPKSWAEYRGCQFNVDCLSDTWVISTG